MTSDELIAELHMHLDEEMPAPGQGKTGLRHLKLMEFGRRDLSFARLAEAHYDACAILSEANREPKSGAIYAVWASEIPGSELQLSQSPEGLCVNGSKRFCSGASLVDRALITVAGPEHRLVEVDLRAAEETITVDGSAWVTQAFQQTRTATVAFYNTPVAEDALIGGAGWYLSRAGFWHGACGPAACWAGGAAGLFDYALKQKRDDPHTLVHLAAIESSIWAARSILQVAGEEIDVSPEDKIGAQIRGLRIRHLIEQLCSDVMYRFARAYGPYPLSMEPRIVQRYQELELYIRQSHGERDLEQLGKVIRADRVR